MSEILHNFLFGNRGRRCVPAMTSSPRQMCRVCCACVFTLSRMCHMHHVNERGCVTPPSLPPAVLTSLLGEQLDVQQRRLMEEIFADDVISVPFEGLFGSLSARDDAFQLVVSHHYYRAADEASAFSCFADFNLSLKTSAACFPAALFQCVLLSRSEARQPVCRAEADGTCVRWRGAEGGGRRACAGQADVYANTLSSNEFRDEHTQKSPRNMKSHFQTYNLERVAC